MGPRPIEHRCIVDLPFDDVTCALTHHNAAIFHDATDAAGRRVAELIHSSPDTASFDATEPITIVVIDPTFDNGYHAFVDFTWSGDRHKRLLANASARLEIQRNPRRLGTTELALHATYPNIPDEPWLGRHHPRGRRILSEALQTFLAETSSAVSRYHHPATAAATTKSPDVLFTPSEPQTLGRFSNILFVATNPHVDPPAALSEAVDLAHRNGATLTLLGIAPAPPRPQWNLRLPANNDRLSDVVAAEITARLDAWADGIDGVDIDVHVVVGDSALSVLDQPEDPSHTLLIIADAGHPSSNSTTRQLTRMWPGTVWIVRPGLARGRTLAAIDPADPAALNTSILHLARSHSQRKNEELHVVHAWELHGESILTGSEYVTVPRPVVTQLADRSEQAHRDALQTVVDGAQLGAHQLHLVNASPTRAISGLVNLHGIDLVVVGATDSVAPSRRSTGSTAEQLMVDAYCSLLIVRPASPHRTTQLDPHPDSSDEATPHE